MDQELRRSVERLTGMGRKMSQFVVWGIVGAVILGLVATTIGPHGEDNANGSTPVRDLEELAASYSSSTEYRVPAALVEDTRITLAFDGGRVSADAGCNTMVGSASVVGSTLVVDGLAMTAIGCPDDRAAQDRWVAAMLQARPTLERSGPYLVLTWPAGQLGFTDDTFSTETTA